MRALRAFEFGSATRTSRSQFIDSRRLSIALTSNDELSLSRVQRDACGMISCFISVACEGLVVTPLLESDRSERVS